MKYQFSSEISKRELSEERYHDYIFANRQKGPNHYSQNPTFRIFLKMTQLLGDINGKDILECGCGDGWVTAELAALGGNIRAFDISQESVKLTEEFLKKNNLIKNCIVEKKSAEEIDYPNDSYDIVFGFAILHHVDLDKTLPQIYRVLKPFGVAIFAEPLEGNPFLRLYRKFTPQYRTPDENPLCLKAVLSNLKDFKKTSHHEFYLTALFPLFMSNFKVFSPIAKTINLFARLDNFLFLKFPFLSKWAWYSILVLEK